MKIIQISILIFCTSISLAYGQSIKVAKQVMSPGGGSSEHGMITLSYTFGQSTTIGAAIHQTTILQQGFQTGIVNTKSLQSSEPNTLEISVFPNPTTEKITVRYSEPAPRSFRLVLFDLKGRELEEQTHLNANEITTSFKTNVKGVYQLLIECLETKDRTTKTLIFL